MEKWMLNSNIDTTIINSQGSSYYLEKDITLKGNPLLKRYLCPNNKNFLDYL